MPYFMRRCLLLLAVVHHLMLSTFNGCSAARDGIVIAKDKFVWRDLTPYELEDWYAPVDLCVLDNKDKWLFPQEIRKQNCTHVKGWVKGCGVGLGHVGHACHAPFASRTHFKRGMIGYTNGSATPVSDMLQSLQNANAVIMFAGDSTTKQKVVGVDCQFRREFWRNFVKGISYRAILPCYSKINMTSGKHGYTSTLHQVSVGPNAHGCLKTPESEWSKGSAADRKISAFENARYIVHHLNHVERKSVLLVINMGLWYNLADEMEQAVPSVLEWLGNVSRVSVNGVYNQVAWHETMRQHYDNDVGNGYFDKQKVDLKEKLWSNGTVDLMKVDISKWHTPTCCQDIARLNDANPNLDWRNSIVRKYMRTMGLTKKISYLPFAQATEATSDMHICHPYHKDDCTHYCWWPLIFQPLFHQLANISSFMERQHTRAAKSSVFVGA